MSSSRDLRARPLPLSRALAMTAGALLAVSATACGGIAILDDGAGGDAATGTAVTVGASKSATNGTKQASTNGTGGPADIVVSILDVKLGADCQPEIGPDPIYGSVVVQYQNVGSTDGFLDITSAQIAFVNPMEGWIYPLSFDPTSSGLVDAGFVNVVEHVKIGTDGNSSFVCNLCGQTGDLTLKFDDGSSSHVTFTLGCAF